VQFIWYDCLKQIRQNLIPKNFRTGVRSLWTLQQRPELKSEQVAYLQGMFNQDPGLLGSWLGVELSCETFKNTVKAGSYQWIDRSDVIQPKQ
jgi:hypothetical protein